MPSSAALSPGDLITVFDDHAHGVADAVHGKALLAGGHGCGGGLLESGLLRSCLALVIGAGLGLLGLAGGLGLVVRGDELGLLRDVGEALVDGVVLSDEARAAVHGHGVEVVSREGVDGVRQLQ